VSGSRAGLCRALKVRAVQLAAKRPRIEGRGGAAHVEQPPSSFYRVVLLESGARLQGRCGRD
jgi:hypothetical protein